MATFIAIIGFAALILMVILLLLDKMSPAVVFILISSAVGFLLVGLDSLHYLGFIEPLKIGEILGTKSGAFGLKELNDVVKKVYQMSHRLRLCLCSPYYFSLF